MKLFVALLAFSFSGLLYANDVRLVQAFSSIGQRYGSDWQNTFAEVAVRKADDPSTQKVSVVLDDCSGGWANVEASFARDIGDEYELWSVRNLNRVFPEETNENQFYTKICDLRFAVRYDWDGKTAWDSNLNQNYYLGAQDGALITHPIYLNEVSLDNTLGGFRSLILSGSIYVQNLRPSKRVSVVYTTDGWETENRVEARYEPYQYFAYSSVESPNALGTEYWTFSATIPPVEEVQFYLLYEVDARKIWDNNWGNNYTVKRTSDGLRSLQ